MIYLPVGTAKLTFIKARATNIRYALMAGVTFLSIFFLKFKSKLLKIQKFQQQQQQNKEHYRP